MALKKNEVYRLEEFYSDIEADTLFLVIKGGRKPILNYRDKGGNMYQIQVPENSTFVNYLNKEAKVSLPKELAGWSIKSNSEVETSRGVAFNTVIAYNNTPVFLFSNDGRGGMDEIENIENKMGLNSGHFISAMKAFMTRIHEETGEGSLDILIKKQPDEVVSSYVFYELSGHRPITSFEEYISKNPMENLLID